MIAVKEDYLTQEEEYALAVQARAGDENARNRLVLNLYPMICKEAWRIAKGKPIDVEDVIQAGMARVLAGFHHYDPNYGVRVSTYFFLAASRAMRRETYSTKHITSPEAYSVAEAYQQDLQRARNVKSLSTPILVKDGRECDLSCIIEDKKAILPVDGAEASEEAQIVQYAMSRLFPRWQEILRLRMAGKSLQEAGDLIGVTRERVRQIEARAVQKLRKMLAYLRSPEQRGEPVPMPDRTEPYTEIGECLQCRQVRTVGPKRVCAACYYKPKKEPFAPPVAPKSEPPAPKRPPRACLWCKKEFKPVNLMQRCCSKVCAQQCRRSAEPARVPESDAALMERAARKLKALTNAAARLQTALQRIDSERQAWQDFVASLQPPERAHVEAASPQLPPETPAQGKAISGS